MKRIFIIYILILIAFGLNAQMYSTSSYLQQERQYMGQTLSVQDYGYNNEYRIGYTTQYGGVYNPSYSLGNGNNGYEPGYSTQQGGPRRAPGDHASGSETVTVDGYSATITWNVEADFLGWRLWTITYSDGTSETFWGSFGETKQHAKQVAEQKARKQAEKMAENPYDPYPDPLTDGILILIMFALLYCSVQYRKKKTGY